MVSQVLKLNFINTLPGKFNIFLSFCQGSLCFEGGHGLTPEQPGNAATVA